MKKLEAFLASPSNRTGLCLILSVLPGIVAQFAVHNAALSGLVSMLCAGILKILQSDNTAAIAVQSAVSVVNASTTAHGDALMATNPNPAVSGKS